MKISSLTDIGTTREMNQDYLYSSEEAVGNLPNLFLVADGMGGHKAGEFASRFAVEAVVAAIRENQEKRPVAILSQSIQRANRRLKEYADEHQQMKGMGTTIVAAVIDQDTLIVETVACISSEIRSNRSRKTIRWFRRWCALAKWTRKVPEITRIRTSLHVPLAHQKM